MSRRIIGEPGKEWEAFFIGLPEGNYNLKESGFTLLILSLTI
jgi:hypothetical protein